MLFSTFFYQRVYNEPFTLKALLDLDRYEDAEEAANEGIAVQAERQLE